MKCEKDKGRMCGSGWRNSIFDIQKVEVDLKSIIGETYIGCFVDTKDRDLPKQYGVLNS